ncbi:MAG: penicillin-binding protein 2 [Patescibacteria group bacterium]
MMNRGSFSHGPDPDKRLNYLRFFFVLAGVAIVLRLGYLQVMEYGLYALLASDQHDLQTKLLPTRGQILVRDKADGSLRPLASNRLSWQVYAVPKEMKDPVSVAHALSETLGLPDVDVVAKLTKRPDDPYERIAQDVDQDKIDALKAKDLPGIGFINVQARFYPEKNLGGQIIGFVGQDDRGMPKGKYGIEGSFDDELAGKVGELVAEKDAGGRRIASGALELKDAVPGSDIVLTIDPAIQYQACLTIKNAVLRFGADNGSILIMNPQSGAIMSMCSSPDFEPAEYGKISDLNVLNNPVTFGTYEPGSVFKAVTMAAGIDAEKITPKTTYVDKGVEEIDDFKIQNSDHLAHGLNSMVDVLDKSLNTGTIFVERQLGRETFRKYILDFGFGKKTGVELTPESKGNVSSLDKKGSIFAATASFGQGITVTPIQLVAAYAAIANGGKLVKPYIVDEIIHPDGRREKTKPLLVSQPISSRASRLVSGMLVSVVENGHGKKAAVPGYWVAGKTGTAQVAKKGGLGYEEDMTIGSFAGYAPANDPKFVMLVKIDNPRDVQWAEASAAPVFGEMAKYLLTYLQVQPERPVNYKPTPPVTPAPAPAATAPTTNATTTK